MCIALGERQAIQGKRFALQYARDPLYKEKCIALGEKETIQGKLCALHQVGDPLIKGSSVHCIR